MTEETVEAPVVEAEPEIFWRVDVQQQEMRGSLQFDGSKRSLGVQEIMARVLGVSPRLVVIDDVRWVVHPDYENTTNYGQMVSYHVIGSKPVVLEAEVTMSRSRW